MNEEELVEYFEYLDDLRESGETNMFGAASFLMAEFGIKRKESREILSLWMKTFSELSSLERAREGLCTD